MLFKQEVRFCSIITFFAPCNSFISDYNTKTKQLIQHADMKQKEQNADLLLTAQYQGDEKWDEEETKKMLERFFFFVKWGYLGITEK